MEIVLQYENSDALYEPHMSVQASYFYMTIACIYGSELGILKLRIIVNAANTRSDTISMQSNSWACLAADSFNKTRF